MFFAEEVDFAGIVLRHIRPHMLPNTQLTHRAPNMRPPLTIPKLTLITSPPIRFTQTTPMLVDTFRFLSHLCQVLCLRLIVALSAPVDADGVDPLKFHGSF